MYSFVFLSLMTTKCASFSHHFSYSNGKEKQRKKHVELPYAPHRRFPLYEHVKSTVHILCISVPGLVCLFLCLSTTSRATITIHYRFFPFVECIFCSLKLIKCVCDPCHKWKHDFQMYFLLFLRKTAVF